MSPLPQSPQRRALCLAGSAALMAAVGPEAAGSIGEAKAPRADVARLDAAIVRRDRKGLADLIEDDLLWIRGGGEVGGKAAFLDALIDPQATIEPFLPTRTRLFADVDMELWTGVNTLRGVSRGAPFVDRHHFADLWRRTRGVWRLAFVQVTRTGLEPAL